MGAPGRFVFLSPEQLARYRHESRAIERRYPHFSEPPEGTSQDEHWQNLALLREGARAELRQAALEAARELAEQGIEGIFPIAV